MSETIPAWDHQVPAQEIQPVTKPRHRKRGVVLAVVALAVITGIIALAVHAHGSTLMSKAAPDNFLTDTSLLEADVQVSLNDEHPDNSQVTDVACIESPNRLFVCNITWDDDTMSTADVQVNKAGDSWVSTDH